MNIETKLLTTEAGRSTAKAKLEVDVPDPDSLESARAAIADHTVDTTPSGYPVEYLEGNIG